LTNLTILVILNEQKLKMLLHPLVTRCTLSHSSSDKNVENNLHIFRQVIDQDKLSEDVIVEVDEFLKAYDAGQITTSPKAIALNVIPKNSKNDSRKDRFYCSELGSSIALYKATKEFNRQVRWESAFKLLELIHQGRAFGVFVDKRQSMQKLEEENAALKERVTNLKSLNDQLSQRVVKLEKENKMLHNLTGDSVGDDLSLDDGC